MIFRLFSLGVVTARDEWVYGKSKAEVSRKVRYLIDAYHRELDGGELARIKWTRAVKRDLAKQRRYRYDGGKIIESLYRPFSKRWLYYDAQLNEMRYQLGSLYVGPKNPTIAFLGVSSANPLALMAVNTVFDYCLLKMGNGGTQSLPIWFFDHDAERQDNITDWALHQFQDRYVDPAITRRDIFDYVYAVLHDPEYREKYELNLKAEFPRIPYHPDFHQWAAWGRQLVALHIDYAKLKGYPLERRDNAPRVRAEQSALPTFETGRNPQETLNLTQEAPRCRLKSRPAEGVIEIDATTTLHGIRCSSVSNGN